jgi:hypothetical protein
MADDRTESLSGEPLEDPRIQTNSGSPVFGPNQGMVSTSSPTEHVTPAISGDIAPYEGVVRVEPIQFHSSAPKFPEFGPYA